MCSSDLCWRLDATEYVLAGGRKAVIFQLQDDHWRLAVASLVAPGETSDAAIAVFDKGVAAHGVPQRLLTDNGAAHGPQPTGTRRTPGGARASPRGRAPRRQGPTKTKALIGKLINFNFPLIFYHN